MDLVLHVESVFKEKFRKVPSSYVAPARINLIGEHTDYNNGFVMPGAIDKHLIFSMSRSGNNRCNIYAADFDEGVTFSVHDLNTGQSWVNYLMGMIDGFQRRGLPVKGVDCVFGGNIPPGAGLSSSAALCCGFGFAINELFGFGLSRLELVKIAQASEHNFVGAMVGIMDQYASLFGRSDSVLFLDCGSQTHEYLPFKFPDAEILLIDSRVRHSIATTAYNDRRASCEEGVRIIQGLSPGVQSLRDVSMQLLIQCKEKMPEEVFKRCRYMVEEIERTRQASVLLQKGDVNGFGKLMIDTHWGLSKEYEVSCKELDVLVSIAQESGPAVLGARMMGGGFGGCTINVVMKDKLEKLKEMVREKYFATFNKEPDFYSVKLSDGVHGITIPKSNP